MSSYNPEEGSYDMGMLCSQQNKKKRLSIRKNCLTSFFIKLGYL